ncbi:TPA: hypothetical protein ACJFE8_003811 [Clostridium sporogenes]|nr:hypothetical protein [Clostridium botulinum]
MKENKSKLIRPINSNLNYDENFICDICFEICADDCGGDDVCAKCNGVCKPFVW